MATLFFSTICIKIALYDNNIIYLVHTVEAHGKPKEKVSREQPRHRGYHLITMIAFRSNLHHGTAAQRAA